MKVIIKNKNYWYSQYLTNLINDYTKFNEEPFRCSSTQVKVRIMGKEEMQKLNELADLMKNLQSQINFLQVQLGSSSPRGGGGMPSSQPMGRGTGSSGGSGGSIDPKQLQMLEQKLTDIYDIESRNSEVLYGIREDLSKLVQGKIEAADERLDQVTRLLEQGLALTEMGTQLTELKDKLDEVLVELDVTAKNIASNQ